MVAKFAGTDVQCDFTLAQLHKISGIDRVVDRAVVIIVNHRTLTNKQIFSLDLAARVKMLSKQRFKAISAGGCASGIIN